MQTIIPSSQHQHTCLFYYNNSTHLSLLLSRFFSPRTTQLQTPNVKIDYKSTAASGKLYPVFGFVPYFLSWTVFHSTSHSLTATVVHFHANTSTVPTTSENNCIIFSFYFSIETKCLFYFLFSWLFIITPFSFLHLLILLSIKN